MQQYRINEWIMLYLGAPWTNCESASSELFEDKGRTKENLRPDVIGFRILLSPVASIVYQLGGYVTSPIGTHIQRNAQKIINYLRKVNTKTYKETKVTDDKESEERFILPIRRKFYEDTARKRLHDYIKMTENLY
jgi:hypothetical protein